MGNIDHFLLNKMSLQHIQSYVYIFTHICLNCLNFDGKSMKLEVTRLARLSHPQCLLSSDVVCASGVSLPSISSNVLIKANSAHDYADEISCKFMLFSVYSFVLFGIGRNVVFKIRCGFRCGPYSEGYGNVV